MSNDISIMELYKRCHKKCNGIQEFFDALDVLYALNKINYDYKLRRLFYAEGNSLQ